MLDYKGKKMIRMIISVMLFFLLLSKTYADISGFKKAIEKTPGMFPFHIIKETAEKISSLGLQKLIFGIAASGMISEAFRDEERVKNSNNYEGNNKKVKGNKIQRITSKGQVYINNIDENEARRRALDDALYYAAIQGGAQIDGISSVNNDTSIEEHFTVRPKSKILDYRILKSYIDSDIYIVEIEAIIGDLSTKAEVCNGKKNITIKEFRGSFSLNTNLSASHDNYGNILLRVISSNLSSESNINYEDYKSKFYDFNKSNFDLAYDYKTLVNGNQDVSYGDFIYIPNIKVSKSKFYPITYLAKNKNIPINEKASFLLDTDVLKINISVDIFSGITNSLVENINETYLIPLNIDSNFDFVELFTKNDNEYILSEVNNIGHDIAKIIKRNLFCQPLVANLNFINNKLVVPLGIKNGIRKNQLAVLENVSDNSNWTILSVNSLTANSAILTPLNSNIKLNQLSGKSTRFLE